MTFFVKCIIVDISVGYLQITLLSVALGPRKLGTLPCTGHWCDIRKSVIRPDIHPVASITDRSQHCFSGLSGRDSRGEWWGQHRLQLSNSFSNNLYLSLISHPNKREANHFL